MRAALFYMGAPVLPPDPLNTRAGSAKLVNGIVVINNAVVKDDSIIQLTYRVPSGLLSSVVGNLYSTDIVAGQSFTIRSSNALDNAQVNWTICKPYV